MRVRQTLTPADVGDIVRATRKATGLRQYQLAGAAGVGLRFIVDLEAGKPTAQIGKVLQVLDALGCSFDIVPPAVPPAATSGALPEGGTGTLPPGSLDAPLT